MPAAGAVIHPLNIRLHRDQLEYIVARPRIAAGGDLILPGHRNAPQDLARLIATHRVTKAAAVPTVWNDFLPQFADHDLPSLREIGGATVPGELIRRYGEHGITVAQGWGMTEMSPSGTMARTEGIGAAMRLVELRLVSEAGEELPWDGELHACGPHIAARCYNAEPFEDGWLRTGDIATIDPDGTVRLVDRAKDLVKSGGSAQLEGAIAAHPGVREAAVIAIADERWGERPLALVAASDDVTAESIREFLRDRVAKWWIRSGSSSSTRSTCSAVGKYDKRGLRERHRARA